MSGKFDHHFDFGFGERYGHAVVPYRAIETEVPSRPGLYSWHFRLPRERAEEAVPFLSSLFQTEELEVSVRANMRQRCCLLYTSPSPRDKRQSRMPSSA